MAEDNFIRYKAIKRILEDNTFFGFTCKRDKEKNRVLYNFRSVRYPNILITVLTLKLKPKQVPSDKIVLDIKFNETTINGWKEFIKHIKEIYKFDRKRKNWHNNEKIDKRGNIANSSK